MTGSIVSNRGSSLTRRATAPAPWVGSPGLSSGYLAISVAQMMLYRPLLLPAHAQSSELSRASAVLTHANLYSTPEDLFREPLPYFCSNNPWTQTPNGLDSCNPGSVAMSLLARL